MKNIQHARCDLSNVKKPIYYEPVNYNNNYNILTFPPNFFSKKIPV